jgi:hypothetical protein
MFSIGDIVTVKAPFNESFPDAYTITDVVHSGDGTTAYILGEHGGFDAIYLELAP